MKILFISNIPSPYRVDFFNELGKISDLTVTFERNTASDRNDKWASNKALNYREIVLGGIKIGNDKALCLGIINVLREKWDAIIVAGYSTPTGIIAIRYLKGKKMPFYIEADGGFVREESGIKKHFKKVLISSASGWFTTGKATTDYLIHYGADGSRCYLYPFTSLSEEDIINNSSEDPDKRTCRKKLGIKEDKVILFVGQMISRKGIDILLKAAEKLDSTVGIYIVGGEPTNDNRDMLKDSERKRERVFFPGFKTKWELDDYFRAAHVFVLPTREDIWGLVVNEAMSYGLPVITTDKCIAGLELVKNGWNGRIVKSNNPKELYEAMKEVLAGEIRIQYGRKSLEIIKNYTIEKMVKAHMDVLNGHGEMT